MKSLKYNRKDDKEQGRVVREWVLKLCNIAFDSGLVLQDWWDAVKKEKGR